MTKEAALITTFAVAVAGAGVGTYFLYTSTTGTPTSSQTVVKVCSIASPNNWRDSIVVPDGWTSSKCRDFSEAMGAEDFYLGCLNLENNAVEFPKNGSGALIANGVSIPECWQGNNTMIPKYVFVSSQNRNGAYFYDLKNADDDCKRVADESGNPNLVGKTFKAWISNDVDSPKTRFTTSDSNGIEYGPYLRVDGAIIAKSAIELFSGSLRSQIIINEKGEQIMSGMPVWTGTSANGTPTTGNCKDPNGNPWSTAAGCSAGHCDEGTAGSTHATDSAWTNNENHLCKTALPVYCFEQ